MKFWITENLPWLKYYCLFSSTEEFKLTVGLIKLQHCKVSVQNQCNLIICFFDDIPKTKFDMPKALCFKSNVLEPAV